MDDGQKGGTTPIVKEYIEVHRFPNGGVVRRHRLVDCEENDYAAVLEIAYDKAVRGAKVFILPVLKEDDPLREVVFEGAKENKCPDLLIDGVFVEVKTPLPNLHDRKISNNIKFAHSQANHVIIRVIEEYSFKELKKIAKSRFLTHDDLEIIEFKVVGRYYRCERRIMLKK